MRIGTSPWVACRLTSRLILQRLPFFPRSECFHAHTGECRGGETSYRVRIHCSSNLCVRNFYQLLMCLCARAEFGKIESGRMLSSFPTLLPDVFKLKILSPFFRLILIGDFDQLPRQSYSHRHYSKVRPHCSFIVNLVPGFHPGNAVCFTVFARFHRREINKMEKHPKNMSC